ncbi:hypothetical protein POM88_032301 [Heracleum sosnowskyi]|uniref:Uncharacterized protein n=1 Tax=Heracleum sosnowskyi TaxID=360622 RepID=A0AAD8I196_9APIA|nr:hypothetical protein POM88_032301 [Heracleum sosnowskyi]
MNHVEQHVPAKYRMRLLKEKRLTSMIHATECHLLPDDKRKSPRVGFWVSAAPSYGSNRPALDKTQLKSFKLQDCGLPDKEYSVILTSNYKDAMLLRESYPFSGGNYFMTIIKVGDDYILESASYKETK